MRTWFGSQGKSRFNGKITLILTIDQNRMAKMMYKPKSIPSDNNLILKHDVFLCNSGSIKSIALESSRDHNEQLNNRYNVN